ncbi:MAG: hypothetical protein JXR67_05935 [Bacteroidales bacterium]|nr:hypothetical protein [Bacteroidales bacterium]
MKKSCLLTTAFCLFFLMPVNAQFDKGKILTGVTSTINLQSVYGSELMALGFISTKHGSESDALKTTAFNLLPRAGYFVIDNLAVGLDVVISLCSQKSGDDYKDVSTTLAIGPFARYYYPLEKINTFFEVNSYFGTWKEKYTYGSSEFEDNYGLLMLGLGPGVTFPVCDCAFFDVMAGYSHLVWKDKDSEGDDKETSNGFGVKIGISVVLNSPK